MSSKTVSDWFPWFYTAKEREVINRQYQNENDIIKSAILTDYNNPNPQPNSNPHQQKNRSKEAIAAEEKDFRAGKKKRPQLNYTVNWNSFTSAPTLLKSTFVQSHLDEETKNWILGKSSPSSMRQSVSDAFAKWFGRTSANGLCFRGDMFVFSRFQMKRLLEKRISLFSSKCVATNSNPDNDDGGDGKKANFQKVQQQQELLKSVSTPVLSRYHRSIVTEMGLDDVPSTYQAEIEGQKNDDTYRKIMRNLILNFNNSSPQQQKQHQLSVLDIGAGDGGVTSHVFAPFFENIFTTEDNPVMRLRLKSNFGWWNCYSSSETSEVLLTNEEKSYDKTFDLVALLNVLDRCDKPLALLKEIREHLLISAKARNNSNDSSTQQLSSTKTKGEENEISKPPLFILAVVLPFCPFVENGNKKDEPSEPLMLQGGGLCREGATFEASLEKLVTNVLVPAGFRICSWTRVPYLCEGDGRSEYYCLDDALFLLEAI